MRLDGEVALVTGSTKGLGRSIAKTMAAEGARVVVTGRNVERGQAVERDIAHAGGEAHFIPVDVTDAESVRNAVDETVSRFGRLTVLVNNAAAMDLIGGPSGIDGPITQLEPDAWKRILDVGLHGVLLASKYGIAAILGSGGGSVVNISSVSALGTPGATAYSASKGALHAMTLAWANDYGHQGLRCNAVVAGTIPSRRLSPDSERASQLRTAHLTRLGTPADIASAAVWLASKEAGFVTGQILCVDGGVTCQVKLPSLTELAENEP
jgi:3-oxoacyl-[acyl-carrier protein] reductase